jgi:hypothetical protein
MIGFKKKWRGGMRETPPSSRVLPGDPFRG